MENRIDKLRAEIGAERAIVGMELTRQALPEGLGRWLTKRGYLAVMVNLMLVKRHKEELDNSPSKSDPKDIGIIADLRDRVSL